MSVLRPLNSVEIVKVLFKHDDRIHFVNENSYIYEIHAHNAHTARMNNRMRIEVISSVSDPPTHVYVYCI